MTTLPPWWPRARAALVLTCIALGLLAGGLTGGGGGVVCGLAAVGVLAGRLWGRAHGPRAHSRWRQANLTALGVCGLAALAGAPVLLVALGLVAWLQVHRSSSGAQPADDRTALLLTLLMVLLASILTTTTALAPVFVLLALLGPAALLLAWMEEEVGGVGFAGAEHPARLGGLWGLPALCLLLSAAFFVALPRVHRASGPEADGGASLSGFNDDVTLGDLGAILDNPEAVMRVRVTDGTGAAIGGPFVFRGVSLDHFDGRRWEDTLGSRVSVARAPVPDVAPERVLIQEISLEPVAEGVLFALAPTWTVRGAGPAVSVDTSGTWRTADVGRTLSYTAVSLRGGAALLSGPLDPSRAARARNEAAALRAGMWSDLPPGLDPRVSDLARELARQAGDRAAPLARARHARDWLRGNFTYTTVPDPRTARQPLETFLFETRAGHCEFFATALAVLLRAQGTPTRVVNGFAGGEYNDLGDFWVLRQRDAHSWVEAWIEQPGEQGHWVPLDATPDGGMRPQAGLLRKVGDWVAHGWDQGVLRYDLDRQIALGMRGLAVARSLSRPTESPIPMAPTWTPLVLVVCAGLVLIGGSVRLVRFLGGGQGWRRPEGRVARCWRRARRLVSRRGWAVPPALPPVEAAAWLRERAGEGAAPLEELAWLHYRVRYGGEPDDALLAAARRALADLSALPKRPRG